MLVIGAGFLRVVVSGPRLQQAGQKLSNRQTAEGVGLENLLQSLVDRRESNRGLSLVAVWKIVAVVMPEGSSAPVHVRRAAPAVFDQPMQCRVDPDKTRQHDAQSQQRRGYLMSELLVHRCLKDFTGRKLLQVPSPKDCA